MDRPTLSNSWSRVSRLSPTLRPRVEVKRQLYRGEPWYVLHDDVSNSFFRLNPVSYHLVGLLDGKRQVDEAWNMTLERYGDDAPTQDEVIGLLGQLNESNLLRADLPPDAAPMLQRQRRRRFKHWGGQAMNILFIRIPLFNPELILKWLTPLVRPIFSTVGLIVWAIWLVYCAYRFLPHVGEFVRDAGSVLAPSNWGWAILVFLVTKTLHELGHGLMCKRFGGVVPEVGIMMLVLFPAPYVDATSSWNFSNKWHRLLVGAAGMMVELAIAGVAVLVWLQQRETHPGSLAQQIAYNTVFLASITTILFNANPLLRFDGYYMLSDVTEIPNLYERAKRQLQYLIQRYVYGLTNVYPSAVSMRERTWLVVYGIAAMIYKVFLLTGIILFIIGQLFMVGVALALWSCISWLLVPLGKFVHWLATAPMLGEHRTRAVATTTIALAIILLVIGVIPMSEHRRAEGVIEAAERAAISIQTDGFIDQVLVQQGQEVEAGDILLVASNPPLQARRMELLADLKKIESERMVAMVENVVEMRMKQAQRQTIRDELGEINRRLADLTLRSPVQGKFVGADPNRLLGQYLTRGQMIGQVMDMDTLRITAMVDQTQSGSSFIDEARVGRVEVRMAGDVSTVYTTQVTKTSDQGTQRLPHPALGYAGGGKIAIDTSDENGTKTIAPYFEVWMALPDIASPRGEHLAHAGIMPNSERAFANLNRPAVLPGERVYVRFTLERKRPIGVQWFDRAVNIIRERIANNVGFSSPF